MEPNIIVTISFSKLQYTSNKHRYWCIWTLEPTSRCRSYPNAKLSSGFENEHKKECWSKTGEKVAGGNQVPHQAPAIGVAMPVNPVGWTDVEVWIALAPDGSSHHCVGPGYDGPCQRAGGSTGEPTST
ncbi:uncharacterized protein LOC114076790 [Solanum pennellii]|uniref:Uncharacterized protein LOC114076790 n=1 Tax=Solanum pennellii TaxID=28526 RepID=A0ABM1V8N7_SOLPN|nr:uncharacterized protein LOC114076790 [Solanum pennellii]